MKVLRLCLLPNNLGQHLPFAEFEPVLIGEKPHYLSAKSNVSHDQRSQDDTSQGDVDSSFALGTRSLRHPMSQVGQNGRGLKRQRQEKNIVVTVGGEKIEIRGD